MKSKELRSGVNLHIVDAPKFKTNLLSVFFNIPMKRETVTRAALLPSVLKRGCKTYPTLKDMSRRLDDLYSASMRAGVRSKGDGEVLYFSSEYISDKYVPENLTRHITEFIRDFIFFPLAEENAFKSDYVISEKTNLKNAIESIVNDKKEYAELKCREAMFGKDGYGMPEVGYAEDLDDITPANLYGFYQDVIRNAKVDIFISGTVDDKCICDIEEILGSCFRTRESGYTDTKIAEVTKRDIREVVEDADTVQSKLCMGLRCGVDPLSDEYSALVLGTCIFGGSPFSKLFNNVREKLSLAYYAVAKTSKFKSVMMISSGIQTENYKAAYDEIMVQFNKMQNGDIEDFEIEAAKKYLTNAYSSMTDNLRGMEDYYLSQIITGTNETIDTLLEKLYKVGKDDIVKVMNKVKFDTVYFLKGKTAGEV